MSFELIWTDHGDLAGHYHDRAQAEADLRAHAKAHPDHAAELALIEIDERTGQRIGGFLTGAQLLAHTAA